MPSRRNHPHRKAARREAALFRQRAHEAKLKARGICGHLADLEEAGHGQCHEWLWLYELQEGQ